MTFLQTKGWILDSSLLHIVSSPQCLVYDLIDLYTFVFHDEFEHKIMQFSVFLIIYSLTYKIICSNLIYLEGLILIFNQFSLHFENFFFQKLQKNCDTSSSRNVEKLLVGPHKDQSDTCNPSDPVGESLQIGLGDFLQLGHISGPVFRKVTKVFSEFIKH